MADKTVKITLVRSPIGALPKHKACLTGLGLRRVRSSSELEDTPAVRGMINKVRHLVQVEGE
jgi:large subunit ribosomal protein L30